MTDFFTNFCLTPLWDCLDCFPELFDQLILRIFLGTLWVGRVSKPQVGVFALLMPCKEPQYCGPSGPMASISDDILITGDNTF